MNVEISGFLVMFLSFQTGFSHTSGWALILPTARRLAALPAPARHAWLADHLAALRAGRLTLKDLP